MTTDEKIDFVTQAHTKRLAESIAEQMGVSKEAVESYIAVSATNLRRKISEDLSLYELDALVYLYDNPHLQSALDKVHACEPELLTFVLDEPNGAPDMVGDVRAFMLIGQPAMCPESPVVPAVPSKGVRDCLEWAMNKCAAGAADLKRMRSDPESDLAALRARLMLEELSEIIDAMLKGDVIGLADGIADLNYVSIGTGVAYGIPQDEVWAEVQRSNMDKYPDGVVTLDAQGKVQKPPGWTPPDVAGVLARSKL